MVTIKKINKIGILLFISLVLLVTFLFEYYESKADDRRKEYNKIIVTPEEAKRVIDSIAKSYGLDSMRKK
jgi:hypothetical protein